MPRYIDADVLRAVFTEKSTENVCSKELCKAIISRIDQIPTADVVPVKHGKWLNVERSPNNMWYCTCSVCKERQTVEVANYCPMCGATMEVEDDG